MIDSKPLSMILEDDFVDEKKIGAGLIRDAKDKRNTK